MCLRRPKKSPPPLPSLPSKEDSKKVAAAQAGFNAVGIWCDLATWTNERTHSVIKAIAETGITVLDIEVAWLQPGEPADSQDRFIEIAKTINAKNILCVSSEPNISDTKKRFKRLCTLTEGSDIRIGLEFLAKETL